MVQSSAGVETVGSPQQALRFGLLRFDGRRFVVRAGAIRVGSGSKIEIEIDPS